MMRSTGTPPGSPSATADRVEGRGTTGRPAAAADRREQIVRMLDEADRLSVSRLAEHFGVTDVSIRRDLTILEEAGQLRRVHGAAVAAARGWRDGGFAQRARDHRDAKARIGAVAATLITSGDVVIFDSGTTVLQVAAHVPGPLRDGSVLTAVTNSLPVIDETTGWVRPHLICLGGLYLPDHRALVGPQTVADLRELSADIVFLGCDGLTIETGLTTPHVLVAEVGSTMVARARRVVAVTDSSKLGRRGFTPIAPISAVDVLVTDDEADPAEVERLRAAGVDVIVT